MRFILKKKLLEFIFLPKILEFGGKICVKYYLRNFTLSKYFTILYTQTKWKTLTFLRIEILYIYSPQKGRALQKKLLATFASINKNQNCLKFKFYTEYECLFYCFLLKNASLNLKKILIFKFKKIGMLHYLTFKAANL